MEFFLSIGEGIICTLNYIATIMNCNISEFLQGLSGQPLGSFINPYTDQIINVYNWLPFAEFDGLLGINFLSLIGKVFNFIGEGIAYALNTWLPFTVDLPLYLFLLVFGSIIIVPYAIWQVIVG